VKSAERGLQSSGEDESRQRSLALTDSCSGDGKTAFMTTIETKCMNELSVTSYQK
jgi:hypothetical protein